MKNKILYPMTYFIGGNGGNGGIKYELSSIIIIYDDIVFYII